MMRFLFAGLFSLLAFSATAQRITVGAERTGLYLDSLRGQKVALVVNQTSRIGSRHLVDSLKSAGITIQKVLAPEHGFRGDYAAGQYVANGVDSATGVPLVSLYGKNKKPTAQQLEDVDVVVFDIQDVGARFYTYISTLHYVAQACAETGTELLVLDRPNPNGMYVEGPVLEDTSLRSFVGIYPLPVLHGLTVGELLKMAVGEGWLPDSLGYEVVPVGNYTHDSAYALPIAPSPNLPNDQAVRLYASLCLFEGTVLSVGRGTPYPFQVVGGPHWRLGPFTFTPQGPAGTVLKGVHCHGLDLRDTVLPYGFDLSLLQYAYRQSGRPKRFFNPFFKKLAGTRELERQIRKGWSQEKIRATWEPGLIKYREMRRRYLMY